MKTITSELAKGTQSLNLTVILKDGAKKIRIKIKSDSYDFQSFARAELWDGKKWNNVCSIPFANMKTESKLYYSRKASEKDFQSDYNELLRVAKEIV